MPLRTATDIANEFDFAVFQVINEIKKLGLNAGRNETLDEELVEKLIDIFNQKKLIKENLDREREEQWDIEIINNLHTDGAPEKHPDFFSYALENIEINFDKIGAKYVGTVIEESNQIYDFDFDSIFIIAEKNQTRIKNVFEYTLNCSQAENNNIIYMPIWSCETSISEWRGSSSIDNNQCKISFNEFYCLFLAENIAKIDFIFLNPAPGINDYEKLLNAYINKIDLSSVKDIWPLIRLYLSRKNIPHLIIDLIENYISENEKFSKEFLLSIIDKVEKDFLAGPLSEGIFHVEIDASGYASLGISLATLLYRHELSYLVDKIYKNIDIHKISKAFVDDYPIDFYTETMNIYFIDNIIECKFGCFVNPYLISDNEKRQLIIANCSKSEYERYSNIAMIYFKDGLSMLSILIKENLLYLDEKKSFLIAYLLARKLIIVRISEAWERDHGDGFYDIEALSLDAAVERYCNIDSLAHGNANFIGMFLYYLISKNKFDDKINDFMDAYDVLAPILAEAIERKKYINFTTRFGKSDVPIIRKYTIDDIDLMTGIEFEHFVVSLFSSMGFETELTKTTGDQGIDIIASKNGNKIGIQAKCYSSSVGNSAIQEAVAGKNYYNLGKAIVVTNSFFTEPARLLAQSNSVILWDREMLKQKINEIT